MKYESLPSVSIERAEEIFISGSTEQKNKTLLAVSNNENVNSDWSLKKCLDFITHSNDENSITTAIVCIGHIARVHGETKEGIVRLLRSLENDLTYGGYAKNALDDISIFCQN